jgi:hypothetical protein|tara:strand:+ start:334 stop:642 length:309 start_codon:yes stop_codon:yes gene_type:complete
MVMADTLDDSDIFRVSITGDKADVFCFGKPRISGMQEKTLGILLKDLPVWVQERIAVLDMRSYEPPTEYVTGVGRRISKDTFWIFAGDKGEKTDGDDTGKES